MNELDQKVKDQLDGVVELNKNLTTELDRYKCAVRTLGEVARKPDGGIPSLHVWDLEQYIGQVVWPLILGDDTEYNPIDFTGFENDS
jgi:hypothetical protein